MSDASSGLQKSPRAGPRQDRRGWEFLVQPTFRTVAGDGARAPLSSIVDFDYGGGARPRLSLKIRIAAMVRGVMMSVAAVSGQTATGWAALHLHPLAWWLS